METLIAIFGSGKELSFAQMVARGVVIFIITLALIRISGRRSFGVRTPLDNIIVILLGALLSRAIVGASPFLPIVGVSFVIVVIHRCLAWLLLSSKAVQQVVEGEKLLLYENGHFIEQNMQRALVCKEDVMRSIRKTALTEDLSQIQKAYMERSGEISVVKKAD